jgi:hypothetical protein
MLAEEAWRLLRVKNGKPHTLFHGFHGSRELVQDKMLRAVERQVWNPGKKGNGPGFTSGWHVIADKGECEEYLTRFTAKDDIVVCRVIVWEAKPKPRATSNVQLARFMRIDSLDWAKAVESSGKGYL